MQEKRELKRQRKAERKLAAAEGHELETQDPEAPTTEEEPQPE